MARERRQASAHSQLPFLPILGAETHWHWQNDSLPRILTTPISSLSLSLSLSHSETFSPVLSFPAIVVRGPPLRPQFSRAEIIAIAAKIPIWSDFEADFNSISLRKSLTDGKSCQLKKLFANMFKAQVRTKSTFNFIRYKHTLKLSRT